MVLRNLFAEQQMEKQTENRLMDMGQGEERMGGMERVTWKFRLPFVK